MASYQSAAGDAGDASPHTASSAKDDEVGSMSVPKAKNKCLWIVGISALVVAIIVLIVVFVARGKDEAAPVLSDGNLTTPSGPIQGLLSDNGKHVKYLGIPFAEPPIGPLRFRPAQPVEPWTELRNSTHYRDVCMQLPLGLAPTDHMSEDCLHANVFVPREEKTGRPVFVWVHGGGFIQGSGITYDGGIMVEKGDMIVVTINYRLGAFGSFSWAGLADEDSAFPSSGGVTTLTDVIVALEWVKENIEAFGGDPDLITVAGESAGGLAICALLTSPLVPENLFQGVIIESGSCMGPWSTASQQAGLEAGLVLASSLGATSLEDMRALNASTILHADLFLATSFPALDGHILPVQPSVALEGGVNNLPVGGSIIVGANTLDTLLFPPAPGLPDSDEIIFGVLMNVFNDSATAQTVAALYSDESEEFRNRSASTRFMLLNADVCVVCPARRLAHTITANPAPGEAPETDPPVPYPTFLYEFGFNDDPAWEGLCFHGGELASVFGYKLLEIMPFDQDLSDLVLGHWAHFARTGQPSSASNDVAWSAYTLGEGEEEGREYMRFDVPSSALTGHRQTECDFWDQFAAASVENAAAVSVLCNGG